MAEYKYDLEIVIPATFEGKYGQRLLDFKEYGLLNIKDKKVLVTLLIGPERTSFWKGGWPDGVETRVVQGTHKQEAAKTYEYFSGLKEDDVQARWTAKIDDDTINDVSNWINMLDQEYDHEREFYVVTECRPEQHRYEDDILKEMGFQRWFRGPGICTIWHELEACVVSHTAMVRIVNNEQAKTFMRKRAAIPEGYNDYALACAARMCKIYPTDAYFMSRHPIIGDLMMFGGHLTHVHEISHDRNFHVFDLLQRMMKNDMGCGNPIYQDVVNQEFVYDSGRGMHIIKLNENGIISGQPQMARIWHIKPNGHLEFLRSDGSLICVFDNYENTNFMEGYHEKGLSGQGRPQLRKLA